MSDTIKLSKEQKAAINFLCNVAELANKKGLFTNLQEASIAHNCIQILKPFVDD